MKVSMCATMLGVSVFTIYQYLRTLNIQEKEITESVFEVLVDYRKNVINKKIKSHDKSNSEDRVILYAERIGDRYLLIRTGKKAGSVPKELGWVSKEDFNKIRNRVILL